MRKLLLLIILYIFLSCSWVNQPGAEENELPKVVFLTTSRACHCTLVRCQNAGVLLDSVLKSYEEKIEFKKIDYSLNQQEVETLAKKYKIFMLPAALFFDKNGEFKGKLDYGLTKENIDKKLKELKI